jgi:hypothetical protein
VACTGLTASLATGIRGATSIYYATIVGSGESSIGFFDLRLDLGRVIRGTALRHISRVIPNEACSPLEVGDFGVVVLGSVDPFNVGPSDVYNFFYVIGPGGTSQSEATAVLSGLPSTDTAPSVPARGPTASSLLLILLAVFVASSTAASTRIHRRRSGDIPAR